VHLFQNNKVDNAVQFEALSCQVSICAQNELVEVEMLHWICIHQKGIQFGMTTSEEKLAWLHLRIENSSE